ncbi:uncharacterized protein LOC123896608 [Trifolium pratense]|uniref:uncharacterized protein LOC123896608 n=1 Tax=Trifolium pratense TaxID=57577 RepID=UPI001E693EAE|nr:uncharacterized protein LOC123896608 [Trifolium pratense]
MDFEASDMLKFRDFVDDGNFHVKCLTSCEKSKPDSDLKELVTCEEFEFENDNDNVPFTPRLSPISSFATCNCKHDTPVKMRDTTIMPVKTVFDNNNSLHISVKKSKVAPDDDAKDDISLSPGELAKSYKKCERKRQFEEKRLKSINREIEECLKELANKKTQIMKEFESEKDKFEGRVKEHQSKEREFEDRVKELESKENKFKVKVKELDSKEKQHEGRVKEHQSKEREFQDRVKELVSKENKFKVKVKELDLKEKPFEGEVKELESKLNKFDGQLKEPELRWIQYEALMKYINEEKDLVASYMHDQSSPTIDETSLLLDTSEKTDVVESLCNDILVFLLELSDPSRVVLDMIQNPIIPLCKKGDNGGIIVGYHIYLLEQLMRISPNIEPCVREEALKLALDLKAYMKENTENSLTVLAFLLLLPIYGLLTSFNEDEVMELFAFVAQHKIAIEMFGTLGFANKVSDFVENLIRRKQFVGAVRFSCAYNLAGKNQLVDMLREHIQNAKLICESSCEKTNSIEIKDKARDEEIASLRTVLQCISDNKILESEDLLKKEIRRRIVELKAQKGN